MKKQSPRNIILLIFSLLVMLAGIVLLVLLLQKNEAPKPLEISKTIEVPIYGNCLDTAVTQLDLNICSATLAQEAEHELEELSGNIYENLSAQDRELFEKYQTAQEESRDSVCEIVRNMWEGGSIAPLMVNSCHEILKESHLDNLHALFDDILEERESRQKYVGAAHEVAREELLGLGYSSVLWLDYLDEVPGVSPNVSLVTNKSDKGPDEILLLARGLDGEWREVDDLAITGEALVWLNGAFKKAGVNHSASLARIVDLSKTSSIGYTEELVDPRDYFFTDGYVVPLEEAWAQNNLCLSIDSVYNNWMCFYFDSEKEEFIHSYQQLHAD